GPRPPVSASGTVTPRPIRGAFLGSRLANPFAVACAPFGIGSRLSGRICLPGNVYDLASAQPPADGLLAPASPLAIERTRGGTGILTRFPSVTPFGLTLAPGSP